MRSLTAPGARPAARLQDPFALRTLPQVHGLALDTLRAGRRRSIADGSCAGSENPAVDVAAGSLAHHGAFHAAYLASALDAARAGRRRLGRAVAAPDRDAARPGT